MMEIAMRAQAAIMWSAVIFISSQASGAETVPVDGISHIHAISVSRDRPELLYLATHHGLFLAAPNGIASRVSRDENDLMEFVAHPTDPNVFYASGHPPTGGNLGVIRSDDGGKVWTPWADGADGPVDFHTMDVSKADPDVIYGTHGALQVSRDGGRTWTKVGSLPADVFDIAASSKAVDTVYAATRRGVLVSGNGGRSWKPAHLSRNPATMVHVSPHGRLYAFIYGIGLLASEEPDLAWETVSDEFLDRHLRHLAVDASDPARIYTVADTGGVMVSKDAGKTWTTFVGHHAATAEAVDRGRALYGANCQDCHGVRGVGERPDDIYAKDEFGVVAPPLDDSAHAWHHSDFNLVQTILNGSPRNERMAAWKHSLSGKDAEDLVAYIKSLWNFRSLACQGARHMRCMH